MYPSVWSEETPPAPLIRNLRLDPAQRMLTWELRGGTAGLKFKCRKEGPGTFRVSGRGLCGRGWESLQPHLSIKPSHAWPRPQSSHLRRPCLAPGPSPWESLLFPITLTLSCDRVLCLPCWARGRGRLHPVSSLRWVGPP